MTALNYVHFIVFGVLLILFAIGAYKSLKQEKHSLRVSILFAVTLFILLATAISVFVVDKYTKHVELSKLKNKRLLGVEKIVYTGTVHNTGNFPIGKVRVEIKIVNKGNVTGNVKGENFYRSTGLSQFLSEGMGIDKDKPQVIVKTFVVAQDLKPGQARSFRVHFDYPPYFRSVSQFVKVTSH